jgi:hypothetical protein
MSGDDATSEHLSDNPAGRLLALLKQGTTAPPNNQAKGVWRQLLGVDEQDDSGLFRRLGEVMALPDRITIEVHALENENPELLLRWVPALHAAFQSPLENPWEGFIRHIDSAVLLGLEMCADRLSRHSPEVMPTDTQLDDLHRQVQELLAEVSESDIPRELQEFVVRLLLQMSNAIDDVRFRGASALRDLAEQMIGAVAVRQYTANGAAEKDNPSATGIKKKLVKFAAGVLIVLNLANQSAELVHNVAELPMVTQEAPHRPDRNP